MVQDHGAAGLRRDGGARVTVAALAWGMGSRESRGGLKGTGRGSRRGLGKEGSPGISEGMAWLLRERWKEGLTGGAGLSGGAGERDRR